MKKKKPKTTSLEDIFKTSDTHEISKILYNNISDLVLFLDTLGRIVHINKAGIDFSGFTEGEVLGKFFLTLPGVFSKEHVKDYLKVFKKTLQGKPTKKFIGKLNEKSGKTHIMHLSTFPIIKNNKIRYIMVIGYDITEEQRITDSLHHSTTVIDSTTDFILSIDTDYTILTWNKIAEQITGYKRQELIGKKLTDIGLFDDFSNLKNRCEQTDMNTEKQQFESLIVTKDKKRKIIKLYCAPIHKEKNKSSGLILIGNNITSYAQKKEQLRRGSSYLSLNKENQDMYDLFLTLIVKDVQGLVVTRGNIDQFKTLLRQLDIQIISLGNIADEKIHPITTLTELETKITSFITINPLPIILLDRIDYFITKFSFEKVVQILYKINTYVASNNAILLVRINPKLLSQPQRALLNEEFATLPGQQIESLELSDTLYIILNYIYSQNQQHTHVSFSNIQKQIGISKATTAKRLHILEGYDLINIQQKGKMKIVVVSDKGKKILAKRKTI